MKKTILNKSKKLSLSLKSSPSYEKDYYGWIHYQMNLLKKKEFEKVDMENLLEEIDSLGKSEKRALKSHLTILFIHLLKKEYQSSLASHSWTLSIRNAKEETKEVLKENPSLKPSLKELSKNAYHSARLKAAIETGLNENIFPKECPWKIEELLK